MVLWDLNHHYVIFWFSMNVHWIFFFEFSLETVAANSDCRKWLTRFSYGKLYICGTSGFSSCPHCEHWLIRFLRKLSPLLVSLSRTWYLSDKERSSQTLIIRSRILSWTQFVSCLGQTSVLYQQWLPHFLIGRSCRYYLSAAKTFFIADLCASVSLPQDVLFGFGDPSATKILEIMENILFHKWISVHCTVDHNPSRIF